MQSIGYKQEFGLVVSVTTAGVLRVLCQSCQVITEAED